MKKSKLSLGLISCLLAVGTLAGCDTLKSSSDGVLLSYTVDGVEGKIEITADEILEKYYNDSTKYQTIYDTIYSVIARNYFSKDREIVDYHGTEVKLGKPQMATIERDAKEKVSDDKDTAQSNADANNTKYKKEFEAILESKGVDSEEELLEKYIEELQKETFENNFYTYKIEDIKNGADDVYLDAEHPENKFWTGYLNDKLPFHVSHILVKLADTSDTNYSNGTISEANAERLYNVLTDLGAGTKTFAKIAMTYNEDPGSKDKEGDLGIMDYDTSFINEFKLGLYAYEQLYSTHKAAVAGTNIALTDDVKDNYNKAVNDMFGITAGQLPTVDMSVINELKDAAKLDKDEEGKPVIENASLVFPRNIIYNKYLNRHAVFFITKATSDPTDNYVDVFGTGQYILCANGKEAKADTTIEAKPIVAVRASSGGEQEIHLMVVNRSPFAGAAADKKLNDYEVNGVKLSDYYTTFYPAQDFYPVDANKNKLDTYVNFLTNEASDTKNRAEEFASKLKSYDSDKLGKYIFLKYMQEEQITFKDEALQKALMKWIKTSVEKNTEEKQETWKKTWNEYIDKLVRQNSERRKLVPQACRLMYLKANSTAAATSIVPIDGADYNVLIEELVLSGKFDYDENGVKRTSDAAIEAAAKAYANAELAKEINKLFKTEGGLCNDGKPHL